MNFGDCAILFLRFGAARLRLFTPSRITARRMPRRMHGCDQPDEADGLKIHWCVREITHAARVLAQGHGSDRVHAGHSRHGSACTAARVTFSAARPNEAAGRRLDLHGHHGRNGDRPSRPLGPSAR